MTVPLEAPWRFFFALILLLASLANSPNPWGNLQEAGALGQALFIVATLQIFEGIIAVVKASSDRAPKPQPG